MFITALLDANINLFILINKNSVHMYVYKNTKLTLSMSTRLL